MLDLSDIIVTKTFKQLKDFKLIHEKRNQKKFTNKQSGISHSVRRFLNEPECHWRHTFWE